MSHESNTQSELREAVTAIDHGNQQELEHLLAAHPQLVNERMDEPVEGYFREPYLLWFIADNPVRNDKLAPNIPEIAKLIIDFAKKNPTENLQYQLDYALGLVSTGRVPRECGVQIKLIDLLLDAGATPGNGIGALAHGNPEAARHLIKKGGKLTLAVAMCLDMDDQIPALIKNANEQDKELALVATAFYGKPDRIAYLLKQGVNMNAYPDKSTGFHSHATALHQAVYSTSMEAVKLLVEAGADLHLKDTVYGGTPWGWANYMQTEVDDPETILKYKDIQLYLETILHPGS